MSKNNGPTILVVDDEEETRKFVGMNLWVRGFNTLFAEDGTEALKVFNEQPVDLVLLDITMPGPDGLEVCRVIRHGSDVPIVFLSGNAREVDKVGALDLGGDDYLTKPFGVPELLSRVNAVLRRVNADGTNRTKFELGDIRVDAATRDATLRGRHIDFTDTEFKLLALLLRNQHKVLTHRFILQSVWGGSYADERDYLRAYIYRLRRKIEEDPKNPRYLISVPGVGYRIRSGDEVDDPQRLMA